MSKLNMVLLFFIIVFLSGCASNTAQSFLKSKDIENGLVFTANELKKDPHNSAMNYYHGRFLLSQKKNKEAIKYFKKAVLENSYETRYIYWLGIAYGKDKQYLLEREQYKKILNERHNFKRNASTRLGRNYYKTKEYENAIKTLEYTFRMYGETSTGLYFYANALRKVNQDEKSKEYFLKYLSLYPNHSFTKYAVKNLNRLGDFTYSNFKIDNKTVSIKNIKYINGKNRLDNDSINSLNFVSKPLLDNKNLILTVTTYEKESIQKAKARAELIKNSILKSTPEIAPSQIVLKWKEREINIKRGENSYKLDSFVKFSAKVSTKKDLKKK